MVAIADNQSTSAPVSLLDAAAANAHLHGQPQMEAAAGWQARSQSPANPPTGSLQGPAVPMPVPRVGQAYRAGHLATRSQPAMSTQHSRSQNGHAANGHSNGYIEGYAQGLRPSAYEVILSINMRFVGTLVDLLVLMIPIRLLAAGAAIQAASQPV